MIITLYLCDDQIIINNHINEPPSEYINKLLQTCILVQVIIYYIFVFRFYLPETTHHIRRSKCGLINNWRIDNIYKYMTFLSPFSIIITLNNGLAGKRKTTCKLFVKFSLLYYINALKLYINYYRQRNNEFI